jgi:tetratricopeptide (TPR) repeat protein
VRLLTTIALVCAFAVPAAAQPPTREHVEAMRHLRLGQENMRAEQWDKAETEFRAAVGLESTLEMAHYGLGQVYMNTKRYPAAVAAYLACRDAWKSNIASRASNDLAALRQIDDQIQVLEDEKVLQISGRLVAATSGGPAELERRIQELRARRFHDDKAMPDEPTWIAIALGSAYFRAGALAEAEQQYREALKVDPKLGEAHNNLAVVCLLTTRYREADAEIRSAEKAGFRVNPQLKTDVKKASAGR